MKRSLLVVLLLVAICASVASAQETAVPRRNIGSFGMSNPAAALAPPSAMFIDRAPSLNLSPEAKDKLKAILTKSDQALRPLRQKLAETTRALRQAVLVDDYNDAKVKELAGAASKAEQAVVDAEIGVWKEIRAALTKDEAKALMDAMASGMGFRQMGLPGAGGPGAIEPMPGGEAKPAQ